VTVGIEINLHHTQKSTEAKPNATIIVLNQ